MNSLKHSKTKEKVILCLRKKANYQDFHCTECVIITNFTQPNWSNVF